MACDGEDIIKTGLTLTQCFEVILKAGHGFCQSIELALFWYLKLIDQLMLYVFADPPKTINRLGKIENLKRSDDFIEQIGHIS